MNGGPEGTGARRGHVPAVRSLRTSAVLAGFFCAAVLLSVLAPRTVPTDLVAPAPGVAALWLVVRHGTRRRVDWAAVVLLGAAVPLLAGVPAPSAVCAALAAALQVLVLLRLLRAWCPWPPDGVPLARLGDLTRLLGAVALASVGGAAVAAGAQGLLTGAWSWPGATAWVASSCVSTVLLLVLGSRLRVLLPDRARWGRPVNGWWTVELATVLALSTALHVAVFGLADGAPMAFAPLALTVWVALRFETSVVVLHTATAATAAVLLTATGHGPFAAVAEPDARGLVVQLFVALLTVIALVLAVGRDEREQLLARLREQAVDAERREHFTAAVLASTDVGIVVVDAHGDLVVFNDTARRWHDVDAATALDPAAHTGRYRLLAPDGTTPLGPGQAPVQRVLREGFVRDLEVVVAVDGRRARRLSCSGRVLRSADGTSLGAVAVMHDVTSERGREEALVAAHVELAERTQELADRSADLERSNTELQQFAGVASHDLSSPLAVVSGYLEMLLEVHGANVGEQGLEWIQTARRGVDRMTDLIHAMLRSSRTGAVGRRELTDLTEVARLAVHDLDAAVRTTSATVLVAPDLPAVHCDPVLVRQLLQNLVGNAVKHHRADRPCVIRVAAEPDGDGGWEVTVSDNGAGIPAEHRERVFGMHVQVDPSGGGHGIGLATCRRIVDRHGGWIRAEETPGGGCTVRFALPQRGGDRAAATAPARHDVTSSAR